MDVQSDGRHRPRSSLGPISYNELPTGRPYDPNSKYTSRCLDARDAPLYPFGYGLSYTTFSLSPPQLSATSVGPTDN